MKALKREPRLGGKKVNNCLFVARRRLENVLVAVAVAAIVDINIYKKAGKYSAAQKLMCRAPASKDLE
jgi:hypothetical protein